MIVWISKGSFSYGHTYKEWVYGHADTYVMLE